MNITRRRLLDLLGRSSIMGTVGAIVGSMVGYAPPSLAQTRKASSAAASSAVPSSADPSVETLKNPKTGRVIKLRARLPATVAPTGLIIYSPGLGSGVSNGQAWCEAWRQAGYVVVTIAHPVTDDSIWKTSANQTFKSNIQQALAAQQYSLRVTDCQFAIDHCLQSAHLAPYIDPDRIGLAGHSYGALTAQTIAGQPLGATSLRDTRIKAVIAFSPGAISPERAKSMSKVQIPFFCITGDHDQFVTFKQDANAIKLGVSLANRELIFANLPPGKKIQLKAYLADHMTFAGEPVDAKRFSRDIQVSDASNQAVWSRVSEMTTAFWEYYLPATGRPNPASQEAFQTRMRSMQTPGDELKFG